MNAVTIALPVKTEADRKLADHILVVLRGLRLSRDLDLAESAVRAERDLTERLNETSAVDRNNNNRKVPAHA